MKSKILQNYISGEWLRDSFLVMFSFVSLFFLLTNGWDNSSYLFAAVILFTTFKFIFGWVKILKIERIINDNKGYAPSKSCDDDFYKIFKVRVIQKKACIEIKEQLFKGVLINFEEIDKSSKVVLLKSEWSSFMGRYSKYIYYQLLLQNPENTIELLRFKKVEEDNFKDDFPFEKLVLLANSVAFKLNVKVAVVSYDRDSKAGESWF